MFVTKINVTIRKGIYDVVHKDVFPYEVPVLEEMYGVGNIVEVDNTTKHPQIEVDPDMEFGRLQQLYGRHMTVNLTNAEYIFGRDGGATIERDYAEKEECPDKLEPAEEEPYAGLTKDQLHRELDNRDIKWGFTNNKARLIELLRESDGVTNTAESG